MAQDFAPLLRSIWSDDDWRALSVDAQHVYLLLLSHPDRNSAGVLSLTRRKWSRLAADLHPDRLDRALEELDATGFIVLDEDTEELCVRAFIRRATVYKHIRMMANALRETSEVESDRIKAALGQELTRLPKLAVPEANGRNDRAITEARQAQKWLDEMAAELGGSGPDGPGHGMAHGMADPLAHPTVVVAGAVVGAGAGAHTPPPTAKSEGGSHVSSGSDEDAPLYPDRCKRHGNTYEPGNCGNCADARKRNQKLASIGPHNPATKPHCGECDETRMLRTRFGAIPCPNCNPAAEVAS